LLRCRVSQVIRKTRIPTDARPEILFRVKKLR
jgi:hypothetical protein